MRLLPHQTNEAAFHELAREAIKLLANGELGLLLARFGYSVSLGRAPAEAIAKDLGQALADASARKILADAPCEVSVVYYRKNSTALRAAVECRVRTDADSHLLVSLVVTGSEKEQFLTLEGISA